MQSANHVAARNHADPGQDFQLKFIKLLLWCSRTTFFHPECCEKQKKTSGSVTRPLERHVRPLFTNVLCRKASQNASNPDVDELRQRKTTSGSAPVGLSSDLRLRWTRDRDRKQTGQRKTRSSAGCRKNFNVPLKKNNNFVFCA